jgi:hypothetical protein
MTKIINLFKFIEKMRPEYPVPFKRKLISDPDSLTANELYVDKNLDLRHTPITSLPDNLTVGGDLLLNSSEIISLSATLKVGGDLYIRNTPISLKYTDTELKKMLPNVKGRISRF